MEKRIVISANSAREIIRIFDMYIQRYGNITLNELCIIFNKETLILN